MPAGGLNSATMLRPMGSAAPAIIGWRRPQRVCKRSEIEPASGSVMASKNSAMPSAMPVSVPGTPRI